MAERSSWEDFEVQRVLGRGTWGTVLLAKRKHDGGLYALKRVMLDKRSTKDQLAAVQEAQLLASLDSPHITRYYDSFLHSGHLVICMEFAPGGSLHAALAAAPRPMGENEIWRVLLHVALALHHMHSRRMLHRDVKTLNIFLAGPQEGAGRHTQYKLGDVGVSKVLDEGKNHASTLIGTPYYLSPELCQEKPYDAKSDMWALGVVLYECATKRHPFDAHSQPSLIMKILRGRYEPVTGLSPDLTAIIHRCLSQSPARRPSAERLLTLPVARAKAAELGIELPAALLSVPPAALASEGGARRAAGGGAAPATARPGVPPPRRATCPHGPAPEEVAPAPRTRRDGSERRSSPGSPSPARASANGERSRKPPLPAEAAPLRRRTDQIPARRAATPLPPLAPRGQEGAAAVRSPLAAAPPPPAAECSGPTAAACASPPLRPSSSGSHSPALQTHFSVRQHLGALSGAAQEWLARRSSGGGDVHVLAALPPGVQATLPRRGATEEEAGMGVERSTKSDSNLLRSRKLAEHAELLAPAAEEAAAQEAAEAAAALAGLRARCVALLGSEELYEELHGMARAAVEGGGGVGEGGEGGTPRPTTLAALGDALFSRVGYSGTAAEAVHLIMKVLALE